MKAFKRLAFAIACVPVLAFAQAEPQPEAKQPVVQRETSIGERQVIVADPIQQVSRQSYRRSANPPGVNDPIPVRKNFQPELRTSQQSID